MTDIKVLSAMLMRHEGLKLKPYRDTKGKLTIGVGRNLDDVGISESEAMMLLESDIRKAAAQAMSYPWFSDLSESRQHVVVNMIFNMGLQRFGGFRYMLAAVEAKDWDRAANEMLSSEWAAQVGKRATELADLMRAG